MLYLCVNYEKGRVFFLNRYIHRHLDRRRRNWKSTQKLYLSKSKEIVLKYFLDKAWTRKVWGPYDINTFFAHEAQCYSVILWFISQLYERHCRLASQWQTGRSALDMLHLAQQLTHFWDLESGEFITLFISLQWLWLLRPVVCWWTPLLSAAVQNVLVFRIST